MTKGRLRFNSQGFHSFWVYAFFALGDYMRVHCVTLCPGKTCTRSVVEYKLVKKWMEFG